jgi:hypothetical protein
LLQTQSGAGSFYLMKNSRPKINIDRLREIGWSLWDPIGLNDTMGGWKGQPFENEYDTYLVRAAGMLRNRITHREVAEYLYFIETEHMGMASAARDAKIRANILIVVDAIAKDPLIWNRQQSS